MDAEVKFKKEYSKYLTNFKALSFDDANKESLCQNTTHKYYNFDKIVKKRHPNSTPSSPDTLIFKGNKVYCVEFKNSLKENIKTSIIKKKIEKGHEVLSEIFTELGLQIKEYQLIFCVVYKKSRAENIPNNRYIYQDSVQSRVIHFDLGQYKPDFYSDIFTDDVDFFRDQFIEKIDKKLPC